MGRDEKLQSVATVSLVCLSFYLLRVRGPWEELIAYSSILFPGSM